MSGATLLSQIIGYTEIKFSFLLNNVIPWKRKVLTTLYIYMTIEILRNYTYLSFWASCYWSLLIYLGLYIKTIEMNSFFI